MPVSRRYELHEKLVELLGSSNVYFQPPVNLRIQYPCIVYHRSGADTLKADNVSYSMFPEYEIIYINPDPDDGLTIVEDMFAALPTARYGRHYVADNLNHDVFYINY